MVYVLMKKVIIWGLFFAVIYLAREFFFLAFMTFLFSYMALSVVDWTMKRFWPGRDLPGRRRLITAGIFLCMPVLLLGIGILIMPHLVTQAQHFIGWASRINPETEVARMLEGMVSHSEFEQEYGNPQDPRYQKALAEFQKSGDRYVKQYLDFPSLEGWIEGSFNRQFADTQRSKIRAVLASEGVSSKEFERWFTTIKYPAYKSATVKYSSDSKEPASQQDALSLLASTTSAPEMLLRVRHDPMASAILREEWLKDTVEREMSAAKATPAYVEQFQKYYEEQRKLKPEQVPYTFDEFLTLQSARSQGQHAFSEAMTRLRPAAGKENEAQLKVDFETSVKHDLFQKWWNTSSPAKFIRHEIESSTSGNATGRMESMLTSLLNVPLDLSTALLLSFLICIDYPAMKRAGQRLRETWLREVYDEIVPALTSLGHLVGTSMYAQGLIAVCNAVLVFCGLIFFGVDHAALLGMAVFLLCLIPTLGTIIAWVLIVLVALVQPGGGVGLAVKATSVVAVVVVLETFVFSPRILGKLMELHPVLIIAILPVAHSFFGIWGLLLAIPVSVYVINKVILRNDIDHHEHPKDSTDTQSAAVT